MVLQVIDQLHAEGIPREEAFDVDEEVHRLAETLLESQPVMLGRGRGRRRMGNAVDAVLGMSVDRCHGRVFRILSETLQVFHMTNRHLDDLGLLHSAAALFQIFRGNQPAEIGETIVHAISSSFLYDPVRRRILPGDLLLRVNFIVLGSRREIQVTLAVSGADTHSVDLVLAGSPVQTLVLDLHRMRGVLLPVILCLHHLEA